MPQARITINASAGSNLDLPINTLVQLDNDGIGGELTYNWAITDQPEGTADALSSATVQAPTFTPRKEGTYRLRLVVNQGLADEKIDAVVASVLQLKTRTRVPAAEETTEAGAAGWKPSVNRALQLVDAIRADPGVAVAQATGAHAVRSLVHFAGTATIKAGLPGEETVNTIAAALATDAANVDRQLASVIGAVDGGAISAGKLVYVRLHGLVTGLSLGAVTAGDPVYVSNTGTISTTPGTAERRVGRAHSSTAVFLEGSSGGGGADDLQAVLTRGSEATIAGALGVTAGTAHVEATGQVSLRSTGDFAKLEAPAGESASLVSGDAEVALQAHAGADNTLTLANVDRVAPTESYLDVRGPDGGRRSIAIGGSTGAEGTEAVAPGDAGDVYLYGGSAQDRTDGGVGRAGSATVIAGNADLSGGGGAEVIPPTPGVGGTVLVAGGRGVSGTAGEASGDGGAVTIAGGSPGPDGGGGFGDPGAVQIHSGSLTVLASAEMGAVAITDGADTTLLLGGEGEVSVEAPKSGPAAIRLRATDADGSITAEVDGATVLEVEADEATLAGVLTLEHQAAVPSGLAGHVRVVAVDTDTLVAVTADGTSHPLTSPHGTKVVSTATYTVLASDHGRTLRCTHADGCAVTVPDDLPDGTTVAFVQADATDAVSFVAGGTGALRVMAGLDAETAGQWALAVVTVIDVGEALLTGQLAEDDS